MEVTAGFGADEVRFANLNLSHASCMWLGVSLDDKTEFLARSLDTTPLLVTSYFLQTHLFRRTPNTKSYIALRFRSAPPRHLLNRLLSIPLASSNS